MRSTRLDILFILGVISAAFALAPLFGITLVTSVLVLLGTLVLGLDRLFGARYPRQEKLVTAKAGGLLRNRGVMVTATAAAWVIAFGAGGRYTYRWWTLRESGPPLDVSYAWLRGRNVDFLLDPPPDLRISAPVNGNEIVFRDSPVYRTLVELRRRFSVENNHAELSWGMRGQGDMRFVETGYRPMRMFVGSSGDGKENHLDPHVRMDATNDDIQSLTDPAAGWRALYSGASTQDGYGSEFLFRRPLRAEDLNTDSTLARFWRHVTEGRLPAGFGWVDLTVISICAEEPFFVQKTIVAPVMSIETAYLLNDQQKTLRLGALVFREVATPGLRTRADDDAAMTRARQRVFNLDGYPLRPNQVLIIPLRLVLAFPNPEEFESGMEHLDLNLRDATTFVRSSRALRFGQYTIDGAQLAVSAQETLGNQGLWVHGPSTKLEKAEIDGHVRLARSVPAHLPFASSNTPVGSCPYFASFDGSRWRPAGTILVNRAGPKQIGTDERPLPAFTGRVRIEEREWEVTTLDRIYVVAVDDANRETMLRPRDARLREIDRSTVQLARGESLVVDFDPPPAAARWFRLGATGYYTPVRDAEAMADNPRP